MMRPGREVIAELAAIARDPAQLVPSPCISVCRMSPVTGWCLGCFRTIDEIVAWGRMPEDGKRAVWLQLEQRVQQPPAP